jgi:hypothetical protein
LVQKKRQLQVLLVAKLGFPRVTSNKNRKVNGKLMMIDALHQKYLQTDRRKKILLGLPLGAEIWIKSTSLEVVVVQELFLRQMRDFQVSKK